MRRNAMDVRDGPADDASPPHFSGTCPSQETVPWSVAFDPNRKEAGRRILDGKVQPERVVVRRTGHLPAQRGHVGGNEDT